MTETLFPDFLARLNPRPCTCPGCGGAAQSIRFAGADKFLCDVCANAAARRRAIAAARDRALRQWDEITPVDFHATIERDRLHPALLPALDQDGISGIALTGKSGIGKTRVAFALLRKAAETGRSVFFVTHPDFRKAVSDCMSRDARKADAAMELRKACTTARVLLIDDIGKGAKDDRADEALFNLLTHRRDHRMITYWTANGGSHWVVERFGADRGRPIKNRLGNLIWPDCPKGKPNMFNVPESDQD